MDKETKKSITEEQEERMVNIFKKISQRRRDVIEGLAIAFEAIEAQEHAGV